MTAEVWEVVGGKDKGGILVREGAETNSRQCEKRLSSGALVGKLELRDVKLHYKLLLGDGPAEGWVSTKITGKTLVTKCLDVSKVRRAVEATKAPQAQEATPEPPASVKPAPKPEPPAHTTLEPVVWAAVAGAAAPEPMAKVTEQPPPEPAVVEPPTLVEAELGQQPVPELPAAAPSAPSAPSAEPVASEETAPPAQQDTVQVPVATEPPAAELPVRSAGLPVEAASGEPEPSTVGLPAPPEHLEPSPPPEPSPEDLPVPVGLPAEQPPLTPSELPAPAGVPAEAAPRQEPQPPAEAPAHGLAEQAPPHEMKPPAEAPALAEVAPPRELQPPAEAPAPTQATPQQEQQAPSDAPVPVLAEAEASQGLQLPPEAPAPVLALPAVAEVAPPQELQPPPPQAPAPGQVTPHAEVPAPALAEAAPPQELRPPAEATAVEPVQPAPGQELQPPAQAPASSLGEAAPPHEPGPALAEAEAQQEPERRMAEDGVFYTMPEFEACYGNLQQWHDRAEVGFAGFEGFIHEDVGGHLFTDTMPLEMAKARCKENPDLAGFCYDTAMGAIPPEGALNVHFKSRFELTPAPGSGWWAWKVGRPVGRPPAPAPATVVEEPTKVRTPPVAVEEPMAEPKSEDDFGKGPVQAPAPAWPPTAEAVARIAERCAVEKAKPLVWWNWIDGETVKAGCSRSAPGIFYELNFPWTEQRLVEVGPAWLTRAFHAAGTLDKDNRVIRLVVQDDRPKIVSDSADHVFFEVAYEKHDPSLHTQLVAKVPLPLAGETYRDRLASSVHKQPMDMYEINAHRLFESELPMRTPRYYFGDISNDTSNWILIVEQMLYEGLPGAAAPGCGHLEGPYTPCGDHQLRRPAKEYYLAVMRMHAMLAGKHQAGQELLQNSLISLELDAEDPEAWGMEPGKPTGEDAQSIRRRLDAAIRFFAGAARALFPPYVADQAFQNKLRATLTKLQAYFSEINYWKHKDPRYVALAHGGLSIDSAIFWSGQGGVLEAGVRDWSGLGVFSVPHRIWWGLSCADFENLQANLDEYIDTFVRLYQDHGGPAVDHAVVRSAILLTAMDSLMFMVAAVPKCLRLCPAEEWSTIQSLDDPRLSGPAGGRGFVRKTVQVLRNGLRIVEEMDGPQVLEHWIQHVYAGEWGETPKSVPAAVDEVIGG